MTRLLIDTNVIIDLLAKRSGFYEEAAELFSLCDQKKLRMAISSLSFANTNYTLTKQTSSREARQILRKFKVLVEILSLDDKITELALNDEEFPDFEDGLQYYSALENQIDIIITRNKKDFQNSKIPVLTTKEFLATI
ncbi:PIN domain-containing protein [Cryomorpha ignava]|uniref:PIN domain-containing protein n=1 Tax=Cryomorpha ignava TaxID=101383 RepID=A0A7K3WN84_9FLAO|nr:PIN domain-containing protein [Cryomorpha ignava]NEN22461.1 PIN domain-containing protein [Cryomorpha ignava]